jgi:simple sugar transport system ATP-binding protein
MVRRREAKDVVRRELYEMGSISATLTRPSARSRGERQSVAIARAAYFGARVLILDEPTSALGVKQAGVVLKYILRPRTRRGCHLHHAQPHHAYPSATAS